MRTSGGPHLIWAKWATRTLKLPANQAPGAISTWHCSFSKRWKADLAVCSLGGCCCLPLDQTLDVVQKNTLQAYNSKKFLRGSHDFLMNGFNQWCSVLGRNFSRERDKETKSSVQPLKPFFVTRLDHVCPMVEENKQRSMSRVFSPMIAPGLGLTFALLRCPMYFDHDNYHMI